MNFKMKKVLLILLITNLSFSQDQPIARVEKSIFGIQTGFFGVWIHNESRLTKEISLRSEIGLSILDILKMV